MPPAKSWDFQLATKWWYTAAVLSSWEAARKTDSGQCIKTYLPYCSQLYTLNFWPDQSRAERRKLLIIYFYAKYLAGREGAVGVITLEGLIRKVRHILKIYYHTWLLELSIHWIRQEKPVDITKTGALITVPTVMIKFLVNQLPNLSFICLDVLCQAVTPLGLTLGLTPGTK